MAGYTRARWIESEDGSRALEVMTDEDGHARFVVHQWHAGRTSDRGGTAKGYWAPVHRESGIYASADDAERDGLLQWEHLQRTRFAGMTVNERLFDAGLLDAWDEALRTRKRRRMIAILSQVQLSEDAPQIADAVLANSKV